MKILVLLLLQALALPAPASAETHGPGSDLRELTQRYRSQATSEARIETLRAIAELQSALPEPSEAVSRALALGLQDEDVDVRASTVSLFETRQHAEVLVDELTDALRAWRKENSEATEEFKKMASRAPGLSKPLTRSKKQSLEEIEDSLAHTRRMQARIARLQALMRYRDALVERLAEHPDDRCVDALLYVLPGAPLSSDTTPQVEALLKLGGRKAFVGVVDVVVRWESEARERERELRKLRRERPGKAPKGKDRKEWKAREERRIQERCGSHQIETDSRQAWVERVAKRLRACAKESDLPAPPDSLLPSRAWKEWAQAASVVLPESIGPVPALQEAR